MDSKYVIPMCVPECLNICICMRLIVGMHEFLSNNDEPIIIFMLWAITAEMLHYFL